MDTNIVIVCAMLIGFIFGGLAGWGACWATHQSQLDAAQTEGRSVGYRQAQREEMERVGQELLWRQSAEIQRQQAEEAARQYRAREQQHPQQAITAANGSMAVELTAIDGASTWKRA